MTETLTLPADAHTARADRIPVAVLGATGSVGQRFVQLLEAHPWFRLHEVVASERSAGKSYGDAADWRLDTLLPHAAASLDVKPLGADLESRLLFWPRLLGGRRSRGGLREARLRGGVELAQPPHGRRCAAAHPG